MPDTHTETIYRGLVAALQTISDEGDCLSNRDREGTAQKLNNKRDQFFGLLRGLCAIPIFNLHGALQDAVRKGVETLSLNDECKLVETTLKHIATQRALHAEPDAKNAPTTTTAAQHGHGNEPTGQHQPMIRRPAPTQMG